MIRTRNARIRLNLYFDNPVFEAIRIIGSARGQTYSEVIRIACREYVLEHSGKVIKEVGTMKELTKPNRNGE